MRIARASRLVLAGCLASCLAAGCTGAATPSADRPVVSAPTSSSAPVSTSAPIGSSTPASQSSRPVATSSSVRASPVRSSSSVPIDGPTGCPSAVLKVMALRASGAAGHQYAFLQFTNTSSTACSLTGFPGVQLLRAGVALGQPASRTALPASRLMIPAGASVTARLVDDSTCNADSSDSVQVIPPNRTDKIVLRLALRGCPLHVDPITSQ